MEKHGHGDFTVQVVNSEVKRGLVTGVLDRHVCPPVQQQLHSLDVTAGARVVQRRILKAWAESGHSSTALWVPGQLQQLYVYVCMHTCIGIFS